MDALGGLMAKAIDHAGIQFRILNASKGRCACDPRSGRPRALSSGGAYRPENQPNLMIFQQAVEDLIVENDRVVGAVTQMGLKFRAKAVVLTVGTFWTVRSISVWIITAADVLAIRHLFHCHAVCVNCRCVSAV